MRAVLKAQINKTDPNDARGAGCVIGFADQIICRSESAKVENRFDVHTRTCGITCPPSRRATLKSFNLRVICCHKFVTSLRILVEPKCSEVPMAIKSNPRFTFSTTCAQCDRELIAPERCVHRDEFSGRSSLALPKMRLQFRAHLPCRHQFDKRSHGKDRRCQDTATLPALTVSCIKELIDCLFTSSR